MAPVIALGEAISQGVIFNDPHAGKKDPAKNTGKIDAEASGGE